MKKFEVSQEEIDEVIVKRHGEKALKFKGWLVSEYKDRWMRDWVYEIQMYLTSGGNYVIQLWDYDNRSGGKLSAKLCKSDEEITEFLGQNHHAQKFYAINEIDNHIEVN